MLDAHMHVWEVGRPEYAWIDEGVLAQNFGGPQLTAALDQAGSSEAVLIQAADSIADTELMLRVAKSAPVAAVVGWVPLDDLEVAERLVTQGTWDLVVGVRHQVHAEPDEEWLLRPQIREGLVWLARSGLSFDLVVRHPQQLHYMADVLEDAQMSLRVAVNHLGSPPHDPDLWSRWQSGVKRLTALQSVRFKISGMTTTGHSLARVREAFDFVLETAGPGRVMWGSDWPVNLLSGGMDDVLSWRSKLLNGVGPAEVRWILNDCAQQYYGGRTKGRGDRPASRRA